MQAFLPLLSFLEIALMVLLFILSIYSIAVMIDRWRAFKKAQPPDVTFDWPAALRSGDRDRLSAASQDAAGVVPGFMRLLLALPTGDQVKAEQTVRGYLIETRSDLEKGLNTLATLGANAPFIGLLGTVLGIIEAFAVLSAASSGGSDQVMAAIAEALFATAAGLFVAIPAVVAFNYYSHRLRQLLGRCDAIKNLYLARFMNP